METSSAPVSVMEPQELFLSLKGMDQRGLLRRVEGAMVSA